MSIDFGGVLTTDNYSTAFVPKINAANVALAQLLDPAYATYVGTPPTGAKRLNAGVMESFNGTAWVAQSVNGINYSGGNIGIGVAAPAATRTTLQFGAYATLDDNGDTGIEINSNAIYNAGWKYINAAAASQYYQQGGTHAWAYAAAGTAGGAITWATAMTLDASGNLGLGLAPGVRFDMLSQTSEIARFASATNTAGGSFLRFRDNTATDRGYIGNGSNFAAGAAQTDFGINSVGDLILGSNNAVSARLTAAGDFLVGTNANGGFYRAVFATNGSINGVQHQDTAPSGSGAVGFDSAFSQAPGAGFAFFQGVSAGAVQFLARGDGHITAAGGGLFGNQVSISAGVSTPLSVSTSVAGSAGMAAFSNTANGAGLSFDSPAALGAYMLVAAAGDSVIRAESHNLGLGVVAAGAKVYIGSAGEAWNANFSTAGAVLNMAASTPANNIGNSGTAFSLDCTKSNVQTLTMTGNVAGTGWTIGSALDGQTINLFITQDATGGRTMGWPTSFKWPNGVAGVLSTAANAVDLLVMTYRAATGLWYCSLARGFA